MIRDQLNKGILNDVLMMVNQKLYFRLRQKGLDAYSGPHESYGIIAEEFNKELLDALHSNNTENFKEELLDIIVACVVSYASILKAEEE